MIYGRLDNIEAEASTLPETILEGLRFLERSDIASLPKGRLDVDGDRMFAMVQDYHTKPREEARPEAHKRYLDIQYIFKGEEYVGLAPLAKAPAPVEDLLEEKDICFYDAVKDESMILLSAGGYAVFYPWDVHRPCVAIDAPTPVRKVVVKIAL